jgi:DNA repair exonuclease SbcCD nuclease subunit
MKTFKFLHLSDLHLDSPFSNIGGVSTPREVNLLKAAQIEALSNAFKLAVIEECKFILIAGDIFDTKYSSIDTQFAVTELINIPCGPPR